MNDTGRFCRLDAQVTLGCHNSLRQIGFDDPKGTHHDTHPTPHTPLAIVQDTPRLVIDIQGPGQTSLYTGRLLTVPTLEGKGHGPFLLEDNARYGTRILTFVRLENIL
jgi:hypothetical protein